MYGPPQGESQCGGFSQDLLFACTSALGFGGNKEAREAARDSGQLGLCIDALGEANITIANPLGLLAPGGNGGSPDRGGRRALPARSVVPRAGGHEGGGDGAGRRAAEWHDEATRGAHGAQHGAGDGRRRRGRRGAAARATTVLLPATHAQLAVATTYLLALTLPAAVPAAEPSGHATASVQAAGLVGGGWGDHARGGCHGGERAAAFSSAWRCRGRAVGE